MIKKIITIIGLTTSIFASTESAISYLQNYNKAILVKDLEKRINSFSSSISTYIVNSAGNPSINSSNQLALNFTKAAMASNVNLFKEDMQLLDGTQCQPASIDPNVCSDSSGIQFAYKYDASNKIPIGITFKPSEILGSTTLDFANEKVIAYLNANNIILDSSGNLVKLFNDTTISILKQAYYITQKNPNISFIDTTSTLPNAFIGQNKVFYSPDGKGGFLIYQPIIDPTTNQAIWKVVGEPEIILTVDSTKELNGDLVVPIGQKVTVLNDNGKAIEYTMQQSSSNSSGTSNVAWNKTSGLYEKNYYFNPIKVGSISLGVSAELQRGTADWDGHTFIQDTYLDQILYNPIYMKEKDKNGNIVYESNGKPKIAVDDGGEPLLEAQSLSSIIGHAKYDGGLGTGGLSLTYMGFYHSSNIFGDQGGRLYFEIFDYEMNQNKLVNFIGNSFNANVSSNDLQIPLAYPYNRSWWSDPAYDYNGTINYHPCGAGFNGPVVYICDVWISKNGTTSLQGEWDRNYKGTGVQIYKINNSTNNLDSCLANGTCNTNYACHHDTAHCGSMSVQSVTGNLNNIELNMKLGCESNASITYRDDNGKLYKKGFNEMVDVNVKPLNTGGHLITYKKLDGINDFYFTSANFNIQYITVETFGKLQCVKRNQSSNY